VDVKGGGITSAQGKARDKEEGDAGRENHDGRRTGKGVKECTLDALAKRVKRGVPGQKSSGQKES